MGIYLNPGNKGFWEAIRSKIYVDKTEYYSLGCDSAGLFRDLKIEKNKTFMEHLNQYDVIFLNMQQFLIRAKSHNFMDYMEQTIIDEIRGIYDGHSSH